MLDPSKSVPAPAPAQVNDDNKAAAPINERAPAPAIADGKSTPSLEPVQLAFHPHGLWAKQTPAQMLAPNGNVLILAPNRFDGRR